MKDTTPKFKVKEGQVWIGPGFKFFVRKIEKNGALVILESGMMARFTLPKDKSNIPGFGFVSETDTIPLWAR